MNLCECQAEFGDIAKITRELCVFLTKKVCKLVWQKHILCRVA